MQTNSWGARCMPSATSDMYLEPYAWGLQLRTTAQPLYYAAGGHRTLCCCLTIDACAGLLALKAVQAYGADNIAIAGGLTQLLEG